MGIQAAEFDAAQARLAAARKAEPNVDSRTDRGSSGVIPRVDWQSRTDPNWAMRLSPYDTVKPSEGDSSNFVDFTFKFKGRGDSLNFADFGFKFDDEDTKDKAQGYDSLGSELGVSHGDSEEENVDKVQFTL